MSAVLQRIMGEPYRIFFLAAGIYAVLVMVMWDLWLGGQEAGVFSAGVVPGQWHAHELIFGYAGAALGGFFLTAVPNWTGGKAAARAFVAAAAALWLAGRIAMWSTGVLPPLLVAVVDLAFLPMLGVKLALMLAQRPKPQNVVFLAFLALVWAGNLMVHLDWMGVADSYATGIRVGLFALCLMIAVLGGRVTPGFTRNALKRAGMAEDALPVTRPVLDRAAIVLIALVPLTLLVRMPEAVTGAVAMAGGVAQILRVACWGPQLVLRQPILWALHLGMALLGLGLILWGLSVFGLGQEIAALHVLGIGAVGGMTLAVMSRAVLGHSGRALVAPRGVALAYGLVAAAAGLRWAAELLPAAVYGPGLLLTGGLWILAFALYVLALWPAFTGARIDRAA